VPWVKLDDQFFVNRKARSVGLEGRALFLASVCYCGMQLNDGKFPKADLPVIAALADVPAATAERLFATGLWHCDDNDLVEVHDYLTWNRSRQQVIAAETAARKAAYAKHAADRTAKRRTNRNAESDLDLENDLLSSSSGNSRANGGPVENPDDDEQVLADVPGEVWIHYANLMLAKQPAGTVKQPVAWKRRTKENAKLELADQAARWWDMFRVTPRHLAECLIDGHAPRNAPRREIT